MSVSKAMFYPESGGAFAVQYNPVDFKFDKPVSWKEHDEQGQESKLEFQKVQPATISMELVFDTTHNDSDVRKGWVNKLLEMTNPTVPDGGDVKKMRPPIVEFSWGEFTFTGVVESVNATYTMFSQQGNPIRAQASLKMKEWTKKSSYGGGGGSGLGTDKVQLVTVQAGQTLSQIASSNNTSMQSILDCNPQITDPLNITVGAVLAIYF
jgi:hypothetical protein